MKTQKFVRKNKKNNMAMTNNSMVTEKKYLKVNIVEIIYIESPDDNQRFSHENQLIKCHILNKTNLLIKIIKIKHRWINLCANCYHGNYPHRALLERKPYK